MIAAAPPQGASAAPVGGGEGALSRASNGSATTPCKPIPCEPTPCGAPAAQSPGAAQKASAPASSTPAAAGPARPPRTKIQRRPVHGVLLLDKPLGLSSNDALQKAKWLLRAEKAGHTGTLDPLATGVLPLCFGAATKFSQLQLNAHKTYAATLRLGTTTTTGDAEGQVLAERPVNVTPAQVQALVPQFSGRIQQVPPMHSALKKDGKALYEYARAGIELERAARELEILELKMALRHDFAWVYAIEIIVTCSKGTYIRTLGEDIGAALGCGGHLTALRRIATGGFTAAQCITLAELEALPEADRLARLLPVAALLQDHVRVTLSQDDAGKFLTGLRRRGPWPNAPQVAVFGPQPDALLGTAHVQAGVLVPDRLLNPAEIQQILQTQPVKSAS